MFWTKFKSIGHSVKNLSPFQKTFLPPLVSQAGYCNYVAVTAEKCRDEAIRDAFITGLSSSAMRQRLLEGRGEDLTLTAIIDKARSLKCLQ